MPGSGYTKEGGDPIENRKRKLADVMGTDYDDNLSATAKSATIEDLMQAHGFVPPAGRPQNPIKLKSADLTSLKDAICEKTGWTYGGPPSACCSCFG